MADLIPLNGTDGSVNVYENIPGAEWVRVREWLHHLPVYFTAGGGVSCVMPVRVGKTRLMDFQFDWDVGTDFCIYCTALAHYIPSS